MAFQNTAIPTFIINLKHRLDRKDHIVSQFEEKNEFSIRIINPCHHQISVISLWRTIKKVIEEALLEGSDYILLCEDDHQFTENYNYELLKRCIGEAIEKNADILCGGVSWFEDGFPISHNLFWVRKFSGLQFTIIFKNFFTAILNADFDECDAADYKISDLALNKYFISPFISVQKEFGYSDVTTVNNKTNRVEELFEITEKNASIISSISSFYRRNFLNTGTPHDAFNYDNIVIPTYVINLPERNERKEHIICQFNGRREFDIIIVDACKHNIGSVGLWQSIRKVVQMAIDNDDDVIIICEDDHEFTFNYSTKYLIENIIDAHAQGCEYLNGGTGKFDFAVPVSTNRYWVNQCLSTQFIVVYKDLFQKILDHEYDDAILVDLTLSKIASNKMIIFPFVSLQRDFGYSDVTAIHNEQKDLVTNMFNTCKTRMTILEKAIRKHQLFTVSNETIEERKKKATYKTQINLFIHTVFVCRENILFLDEWLHYHILVGFDHFYLYDNSHSIGRNGSTSTTNKYDYNFSAITSNLSDKDIEDMLRGILKKYDGYITLVDWRPKNEAGKIVYGQNESILHYIKNTSPATIWTAFIDMDEFIYSRQPMKDFVQLLDSESYSDIILFQKKFDDRFNNINIPVTQITQCIKGIDTKYWAPKHILKNKNFEVRTAVNGWSIHHLPIIENTQSFADGSLNQIRFNHYNVNEKLLRWMKTFYKSETEFSLNGECSELLDIYTSLKEFT